MIEKYVAPPPSTPKATKLKFSQEPPELQTFNEKELATKVKWSWKGTIVGCERSILKRVRGRIRTAKWQKEKDEPSQRTTATSPPKLNQERVRGRIRTADWQQEKHQEKIEKAAQAILKQLKFCYGIDDAVSATP